MMQDNSIQKIREFALRVPGIIKEKASVVTQLNIANDITNRTKEGHTHIHPSMYIIHC